MKHRQFRQLAEQALTGWFVGRMRRFFSGDSYAILRRKLLAHNQLCEQGLPENRVRVRTSRDAREQVSPLEIYSLFLYVPPAALHEIPPPSLVRATATARSDSP
jgi:hypothetical protein